MKPSAVVLALALAAGLSMSPAARAQQTLLSLSDPQGDDVGDGSLVYPRETFIEPGDLDLLKLEAFAEAGGLRFVATFRNPVRDPAQVRSGSLGSEDLSLFARRGFYAFNLDIYLDTDRQPGSGQLVALPGRHVRFDPAQAWDKAIVLTPRPELMRRQFGDVLAQAAPGGSGVESSIDGAVYFVRDVRVRGRTVTFSVPSSFVDPAAVAGASVVALVTAAKLSIEADAGAVLGRGNTGRAIDRLALGAIQPERGRPAAALGYDGDKAPATAVVDLLTPDPQQQGVQLASGTVTGLNRENRYGAVPMVAPVRMAAPEPASAPPATGGNWFSRALGAIGGLFASERAPAAPPVPASPVPSLQTLIEPKAAAPAAPAQMLPAAPARADAPAPAVVPLVPAAPAAQPAAAAPAPPRAVQPAPVAPAPAPAAAARGRDAAFFEEQEQRLRALKRLRDNGLITEDEYQKKRKEVLDAL